jgi:hypothetical protein
MVKKIIWISVIIIGVIILITSAIIFMFSPYNKFFKTKSDILSNNQEYTLKLNEHITIDGFYIENKGGGFYGYSPDYNDLFINSPTLLVRAQKTGEEVEIGFSLSKSGQNTTLSDDLMDKVKEAFGRKITLISTEVYPGNDQIITFSVAR